MCSRMYSCDCAYISQVDKDSRSFSRKRCMCLSFPRHKVLWNKTKKFRYRPGFELC